MKFASYITAQNKNHPAFESPFASNAAAAFALDEINEKSPNDFATNLLRAFAQGGDNLSTGRAYWLHKLAMPKVEQQPVATVETTRIRTMLDSAAQHLKRPAIRYTIDPGGRALPIKISRAKDDSKNPGCIYVASPDFGGAYYGKIDNAGQFFPGRDIDQRVLDFLSTFSDDPEAAAAAHGHATGCCCFCNRALSDEKSTSVGYGPVCARRYGLKHGTTTRRRRNRVVAVTV